METNVKKNVTKDHFSDLWLHKLTANQPKKTHVTCDVSHSLTSLLFVPLN